MSWINEDTWEDWIVFLLWHKVLIYDKNARKVRQRQGELKKKNQTSGISFTNVKIRSSSIDVISAARYRMENLFNEDRTNEKNFTFLELNKSIFFRSKIVKMNRFFFVIQKFPIRFFVNRKMSLINLQISIDRTIIKRDKNLNDSLITWANK